MQILASPAFSNEKVNPYNALLYHSIETLEDRSDKPVVNEYSHKKALLEKQDILHFHWPDGYVNQRSLLKSLQRAALFWFVLVVNKLRGTKIVWTVHNVVPHDAHHPAFSQHFMHWFVRRCDGLIFMSDESRKTFLNSYSSCKHIPYAIIPHGHYRRSYAAPVAQFVAKSQLGLAQDKKVLLFTGMIKPYKNIDKLIELFVNAGLEGYQLVVAGSPDSTQLSEKLQQLKHPDLHLFLHFIPDNQLHIYLSAADIIILPYKAVLNSGALLLALSFNKPVIAPDIGAFMALQQELGNQWIYCYQGELSTETLQTSLQHFANHQRPAICPLENYEWHKIGNMTLNFYQQLLPLTANPSEQVAL